MRNRIIAMVAVLTLAVAGAQAQTQENSLNTFSPYTMYGLGSLNPTHNTAFTGMGGASIGFRNDGFDYPFAARLNLSNPASLSGLAPKTFFFDVGLAGSNFYLKQRSAGGYIKSSFNTFNINNVTAAFSIAGKLGVALNVSPYSEVGYRVHTDDTSYLEDLGVVRYHYNGQGDVSEAKLAMGWEPFDKLSVGAELIYLWGNIDRIYQAEILDYTGSGSYSEISSRRGATANTNEKVSRLFAGFGVQYNAIDNRATRLTLGATYRLGGKLNSEITDFIPSNNVYGDTVRFSQMRSSTRLPQTIGVGAFFHRQKWAIGADWVYQDWGAKNSQPVSENVTYTNTNTFKLGAQFTPNRLDIRGRFTSFFNRITYKVGVRYGNNYLKFMGQPINEKAVSLGFDIPFRAVSVSTLNLGLEFGQRGRLGHGLVRENFFKVNVGVMLFGRDYDYWFEKYKYN